MKLGKQLAERAKEAAMEKEEAQAGIAELERMVTVAESIGAGRAENRDRLEGAKSAFARKDYRETMILVKQYISLISNEMRSTLTERHSYIARMNAFLKQKGCTVQEELPEAFSALLLEGRFEEANRLLHELLLSQERIASEYYARSFSELQKRMLEARGNGIEISGVEEMLDASRNEMALNNTEKAFNLLENALHRVHSQLSSALDAGIMSVRSKLDAVSSEGIVSDGYEQAIGKIQEGGIDSFAEAMPVLSSIEKDLDERLRKALTIHLNDVKRDMMEAADGMLPQTFASRLEEAGALIERGKFAEARSEIMHLAASVEQMHYDAIARILLQGKRNITTLVREGIDLSAVNSRLNHVRELMKQGKYSEAVSEAESVNRDTEEMIRNLNESTQLMEKLNDAHRSVLQLIPNSVDVELRFTDTVRLYERKDFNSFIRNAPSFLMEMYSMLENYSNGQIDALDKIISSLEYLGAETLDFNRAAEGAVALLKNKDFVQSMHIVDSILKQVDAKLRELSEGWLSRASAETEKREGIQKERLVRLIEVAAKLNDTGDYYRAACIAKDVFEWAINGDEYRVNVLVQRTLHLISSVPDTRSMSASNLLDAAQRNMRTDTEGALKLAGEAYDITYKLIKEYFSSEISSVMKMVSSCRRRKVEIGYGYTLIGRAQTSLKYEDFETAFRMLQLARNEIQTKLNFVEDVERRIGGVERLLAEARRQGTPVKEEEARFQEANSSLKRFDYVLAGKTAEEVKSMLEMKLATSLATQQILRLKALTATLSEAGALSPELEQEREQCALLMKERKHYDALLKARRATGMAEDLLRTITGESINLLSAEAAKAEMDGLDANVVEGKIQETRNYLEGGQFDRALSTIRLAEDEMKLLRNSVSEAAAVFSRAENFAHLMDELNLGEMPVFTLLKQARAMLKSGKHLLALQSAQKCIESCSDALKHRGSALLDEIRSSLQTLLPEYERNGMEDRIFHIASEIAMGTEKGAEELSSLLRTRHELLLQKEVAARTVEVVAAKLGEIRTKGNIPTGILSIVERMERLISEAHFREAIERGIEAEQKIAEYSALTAEVSEQLEKLKDEAMEYGRRGIDVSGAMKVIEGALSSFGRGEPAQLRGSVIQAREAVEKALHSAALEEIAAAKILKDTCSSSGAGSFDMQIAEAERELSEGRILAAYDAARKAFIDMSSAMVSRLRALFSSIAESSVPEEAVREAGRELDEMIVRKQFNEALAFIENKRAEFSRKARLQSEMENYSVEFARYSSYFRRAGISARAMEARYASIMQDINEDAPERMRTLLEEMRRMKDEYSPVPMADFLSGEKGNRIHILNSGKSVALQTRLVLEGNGFRKEEEIGNLKAGEERIMSITVPEGEIRMQLTALNPVDGEEIRFERTYSHHGGMVRSSSPQTTLTCEFCRGRIREGAGMVACSCGALYHVQCAKRRAVCSCGKVLPE